MSDEPDIRELVGDDVPEEDLAELSRVDALLRSVAPPPPEVPASLTRAVRAATPVPLWTQRRLATAVVLAAALSALFFAVGTWVGDGSGGFDARASIPMKATGHAPGAAGIIRLGPRDAGGNWTIELRTEGLPKLAPGGYYVLWLARDGKYAGTCGTFRADGAPTTVMMNASYVLSDYDAWVVTAVEPNQPEGADTPWLLQASIA